MKIVTRISPSPTGSMHLGTARTALFNWLYSRQNDGEFLIRIEDTDKDRNDDATIQPIMDGLAWLGLVHDREIVMQSANAARHVEVARQLLASGHAYRCYMTSEELESQRKKAARDKTTFMIRSPWREVDESRYEGRGGNNFPYAIRLKMPQIGETTINDLVQGPVTVQNATLDDMIILRADGTPTYMLAVVVDDHDAGVTTVIRGDDHLNNAFRQIPIYRAMGWPEPTYGHLPLIHDEAGKKLSKRHGAAGLETYRDGGYTSDTMFNYLLRLGWGHGDHEIFSREEALRLFDITAVGRAPARIDQKRLDHLSGVYLQNMTDEAFRNERLTRLGWSASDIANWGSEHFYNDFIDKIIPLIRPRSKTFVEAESYITMVQDRPNVKVDDPEELLLDINERIWSRGFTAENIKNLCNEIAEERSMKLKNVVAPLRLAMMGSKVSPPLFEVMAILGADESQERIQFAITGVERVKSLA